MCLDVQSSVWVGETDYAEVDDHDQEDGKIKKKGLLFDFFLRS